MEQIIASLNLEIQALKNASASDRVQINTLVAQVGALMGRTNSLEARLAQAAKAMG